MEAGKSKRRLVITCCTDVPVLTTIGRVKEVLQMQWTPC